MSFAVQMLLYNASPAHLEPLVQARFRKESYMQTTGVQCL
jgi:hypothetical protein